MNTQQSCQIAITKAVEVLGVTDEDDMRVTLKNRGFNFMYSDGRPIFNPIRRIDTYNVEDIQDLWAYLIYPMRFYFDAIAHSADTSTMTDEYKMDAILEWTDVRRNILDNAQLFSEADAALALDGAYLYRTGWRLFQSKQYFSDLGYTPPDGRKWLFTRRLVWRRETDGMIMARFQALWREEAEPTEPPASLHDVMTAAEVAEVYGLDHGTIRVSIHKGYIPARKSGGTWLIARSDAERRWGKHDS